MVDLGMVGTEMVYFAVGELGLDGGIAVTASHNPKEYTGMKIVRRGALPVGGDSGLLDIRDSGHGGCVARDGANRDDREGGHLAAVRRARAVVHRRRCDQAAARRDRRRQRHGRRHAAAGPRTPADRGGALLLRARRHVPEPRAEPAAAREPRVHHPQGARRSTPTSALRSTATPTAASSSTTPASSSRATSSRRCWPSRSSRRSLAERSSTTCARAGPCRRRSSAPAAFRS